MRPRGTPMEWRAQDAGKSEGRSVMERIGTDVPLRKRADFQRVVRDERAGRTFIGGNRK